MAAGTDSSSNSGPQDPYSTLGLEPGASFEAVQKARELRLSEVGEDSMAKAKIEASYDALLMVSLKERQSGKLSNDAFTASQKEERNAESGGGVGSSLLTRLTSFNSAGESRSVQGFMPELALPDGQGLIIRIILGILAVVLVLVSSPGSIEIILSLSTIGLFISQIRRGRRPLPSLGWSVLLLSLGLVTGGLLFTGSAVESDLVLTISGDQLEALPAIILMWGGTLFLA